MSKTLKNDDDEYVFKYSAFSRKSVEKKIYGIKREYVLSGQNLEHVPIFRNFTGLCGAHFSAGTASAETPTTRGNPPDPGLRKCL